MGEYEEVWERFTAERRLEFGGHMDPDWQGGHRLSASLIVPVDAVRFGERLKPLRDALRPFPFVSLHPYHFMHVTLVFAGFPVEKPEREGELSRKQLAEIGARARQALSDFPSFEVRLANLNAFPGAAFVETHDGAMLENLREILCEGCGLKKPLGPPHLTVAYFQVSDGTPAPQELISAIERYRDWPIGKVTVQKTELSLLDLRPKYPVPEVLAEIPLR